MKATGNDINALRNSFTGKLVFVLILIISSYCSDEPEAKVPLKLPFDSFWISTEFDGSPFTSANEYFDTWAEESKYPASDVQTFYNYWETTEVWGEGKIPDGCAFGYEKTAAEWNVTLNCSLERRGTVDPNDPASSNWPEELQYEINMVANLQTMEITSAKLSFPQFNQIIDFTDQAAISQGNLNGYDLLTISASGDIKTNDSHVLKTFINFGEML